LTGFDIGCVKPKIGPLAFQGTVQKGVHLVVDLFAQAADLALGNPANPHGLHQIVDRAGGHALDKASWMTAVSAFSLIRRGSRKPGK
jgi:hypothetical protein